MLDDNISLLLRSVIVDDCKNLFFDKLVSRCANDILEEKLPSSRKRSSFDTCVLMMLMFCVMIIIIVIIASYHLTLYASFSIMVFSLLILPLLSTTFIN
jgi:hypothetical protein